MLKNLTISGKVNFITEIIAIITWAILLIAAKDDWQFFAVFSVPLLILIPICGWFLMPVSKKISEKGKSKSGWRKAALYAGMFIKKSRCKTPSESLIRSEINSARFYLLHSSGSIIMLPAFYILVFSYGLPGFRF